MDYPESGASKILIVDDNPASRITAVMLLVSRGYYVREACDGEEALLAVPIFDPDLILLDIMMPGMDGLEVCKRLKGDELTRIIPIIFLSGMNDSDDRVRGIEAGGDDYLKKPFDRFELFARVKSLLHQKKLNQDLEHAEQMLFSIARAVESRDPNTGDHCERLVQQGKEFGNYLGLSSSEVQNLMWGAYLHDIGKLGIPDSVLLKEGKLTDKEWSVMKQHVTIGVTICNPLRFLKGVLPIIHYHHERWDGSGYPEGLRGKDIPSIAQIFQILDIYDALTSERPYKRPFSPEETIRIMQQETDRGWRNPDLMKEFSSYINNPA